MNSGSVIIILSLLFGLILIGVGLGLLFGVKPKNKPFNGGSTGATGDASFKTFDLCLYEAQDPGFSPYTYLTKLNKSNSDCYPSTSYYTYKDKLRVYYKKKEPSMDKFCIYDTGVASGLYKNTSLGLTEGAVVPGGDERCPIIPVSGIRLIDSFYINSSVNDTNTNYIDSSYNTYCSYAIADHPKDNGGLRSKFILEKKTTSSCPARTFNGINYTNGPTFYFEKIS